MPTFSVASLKPGDCGVCSILDGAKIEILSVKDYTPYYIVFLMFVNSKLFDISKKLKNLLLFKGSIETIQTPRYFRSGRVLPAYLAPGAYSKLREEANIGR
jgi:hypothetical protein